MADEYLTNMAEVRAKVTEISEMLTQRTLTDHDLLIRLNTLSERVAADLNDLKSGVIQQVSSIETRIRALEQARWTMMGAASVLGAIAGFIAEIIANHK